MYRIINPTQHSSGMFAFIWHALRAMYTFPEDKYYIKFGRECCYFDEEMYQQQGIDNVWDYYFEQPHIGQEPSKDKILSVVGHPDDMESEYRTNVSGEILLTDSEYTEKRIKYGNILKEHVRLLPHILEKIDKYVNTYFKDKLVLGLHCRGTDHPDKLPMSSYIDAIKQYEDKYDYIFVTSDEQHRVDYIKQIFGEKVLEYNATFRSPTEAPIHYNNIYNCSKYYIGEDVIIEAYLLSKVDMLLCCTGSNVNFFTRIINPELPYKIIGH